MPRPSIDDLLTVRAAGCVTLSVPLRPAHADRDRVRLEIRRAVETARARLTALGIPPHHIKTTLAPVVALYQERPDVPRSGMTLLAFLTPGTQSVHVVDWALPPRVEVSDRFHLADLIAARAAHPPFFVLTLADDGARLLRCVGPTVEPVPLALARADREAANRERVSPVPGGALQVNTSGAGVTGAPTTHKQGFGHEDRDAIERATWYRVVYDALDMAPLGAAPLVLVADVVHHQPFIAGCRTPNLLAEGVQLNPAGVSNAGIMERARAHVEAARELPAPPSHDATVTALPAIIEAAKQGQIDTLFYVAGRSRPGRLDERIEAHDAWRPGDVDLVDAAVRATLETGGDVVPVGAEMLAEADALASLRWTRDG